MKRRSKGKKRRSAAQKRATAKMLRHNRSGRKGHPKMAKRRRKTSHKRRSTRRSTRRVHHRRRRGGGHSGGGAGLALLKHDVPKLIAGAVYGKLEALAKADDAFFLNKVPRPITAVGYTGNIALALYAASMFIRHPYIKLGASTVATIAMYKMGKNGGAFQTSDKTSIGGDWDGDSMEGDERVIDDHTMGALDAEAREFSGDGTQHSPRGLSYDDVVQQADTRV
jgi:hypothetical protein